jgi:integrase
MGTRTLNRLTHTIIINLTIRGYYADGGGLYFRVSKFGTKSWSFRFERLSKAREMGLGAYPDVSLKEARERAAEARKLLRDDIDPITKRRADKEASWLTSAKHISFDEAARRYIETQRAGWKNIKHAAQWESTIRDYASPVFGKLPVASVDTGLIVNCLSPIWVAKNETASRLRGRIESILDWATVTGYRHGLNPARWKGHLDKLLAKPSQVAKVEHHAALPFAQIGAFMVDLGKQAGMGARALEFVILTAARSGEVRGASWSEIDLDAAVWTIPAGRMKAEKEHRIPLSDAALGLLHDMPHIEGTDLTFPNGKCTQLSDMTLTAVLRRMGVAVTAHGFRSTFRDWAGETTAYPREVIEHALAHQLRDAAEAAYARGTLFDKRRQLMADWARFCNTVGTVATVTSIMSKTAA